MPLTAVRPAAPEDAGEIVRLVRALAAYEHEPLASVKLTEAIVGRDAFGPTPRFQALLGELDGEVVGLALYFHNYSTWEGRPGLFLEDLFVEQRARGHGLGRALLVALARIAAKRGCGRIELNVLDWNPAREFYHRLGIEPLEAWRPYRMNEAAIRRLAEGGG